MKLSEAIELGAGDVILTRRVPYLQKTGDKIEACPMGAALLAVKGRVVLRFDACECYNALYKIFPILSDYYRSPKGLKKRPFGRPTDLLVILNNAWDSGLWQLPLLIKKVRAHEAIYGIIEDRRAMIMNVYHAGLRCAYCGVIQKFNPVTSENIVLHKQGCQVQLWGEEIQAYYQGLSKKGKRE